MISETFKNLKNENRAALTIFVTCGDPSISFTEKLIEKIALAGADIIELGVPFSDPMADGATIQKSSVRALEAGVNILQIVDMASRLRKRGIKTPFVLFGYFNVFFKCGLESLASKSKDAGIDAWLIADLPLEERGEVAPIADKFGIDLIGLAAPTTPLKRVEEIANAGGGFLYYISVAGVTGARAGLPENFEARIKDVRAISKLPVGIGFGISNFESAHEAAKLADSVIVGSKFIDLVFNERVKNGEEAALIVAQDFVLEIARAMSRE